MATLTITPIKTFISGETVTPAKLNELSQSTVALTAGTIVDADVSASAAIALSKLATGALPTAITTTTGNLVNASVTQAKLAAGVAGNGPAFRAYANSATTSFSNGVAKKVDLQIEDYDTDSCFASSRFTPNVAGYYFITGAIRWENITSAQALLYKNGAGHSAGSSAQSGTYHTNVSDLIYLNGTTDYVELFGIQYTGTTQNAGIPGTTNTYLSGFLARAA